MAKNKSSRDKRKQERLVKPGEMQEPALLRFFEREHEAIEPERMPDELRRLLDAGADLDAQDEEGRTILMASEVTDGPFAQYLLTAGAGAEVLDAHGRTALHYAARFPLSSSEWNAPREFRDVRWETAWWRWDGKSESPLSWLLYHGANVDARDTEGRTPLVLALGACAGTTVLRLREWEASAEALAPRYALQLAALEGDADAARRLIDGGVSPDVLANEHGWTSLRWAIGAGSLDVARVLLEAGASPGVQEKAGGTPLHAAALKGDTAMASLLLDYRADPNLAAIRAGEPSTYAGGTPLDYAVSGGNAEMVSLLLGRGAIPGARAHMAMSSALREGHLQIVRLMLDAGVAPTLTAAAALGDIEIVRQFVRDGVIGISNEPIFDPQFPKSPLEEAAYWGRVEVVLLLLDTYRAAGFPMKARLRTAQGLAVKQEHHEVAQILGEAYHYFAE